MKERLEATIGDPIAIGEATVRVKASIGCALLAPSFDLPDAIRRADDSMFRVKHADDAAA